MTELFHALEPFGEPGCESELIRLGSDEYSRYYFQHTPFNDRALDRKTYLIIGRRGSGKTALANFFLFQSQIPNTTAIDVDEPTAFHRVIVASLKRILNTLAKVGCRSWLKKTNVQFIPCFTSD